MFDIKKATEDLLAGCIIRSESGVVLFTPDGRGHYPALWTRDFAYMLRYADDLITPDQSRACLEYLLQHADANGWIPDRVDAQGVPAYTAGGADFPALPNLDNGPFMILAADAYMKRLPQEEAKRFFGAWETALVRGIACLPRSGEGILINDTTPPHSPYGFTDTVCKTGLLAMETLLYWESVSRLLFWQTRFTVPDDAFAAEKHSIEQQFGRHFVSDSGMLYAATGIGRQIDVWASCYLLAIGFPVPENVKQKIVRWLKDHKDGILYHGQMRQLPAGEYWEKTLIPVERNTYQNGAFWAVPTVWLVQAVQPYDAAWARAIVADVLRYFADEGIYECVYEDNRKLETYVTSATNVYGAAKLLGML